MTPRQKECLRVVEALLSEGIQPTYQTIADRMGYANRSRAFYVVRGLLERGMLIRAVGRWNSFSIPSADAESIPFDRMAEAVLALKLNDRSFFAVRQALVRGFTGEAAA